MNTVKISLLLLFLGLASLHLRAQEEPSEKDNAQIKTLFNADKSVGGYAGIVARYSDIGPNPGMVLGARGCFIAGHRLAIGLAGNALIGDKVLNDRLQLDGSFSGGYGGLLIEPILFPKFPVHISIPIVMGAGGISYSTKNQDNTFVLFGSGSNTVDSKSFFILEPGVELEINVLKFFRLAVGGYYRYTNNINLRYDNSTDLIAKADFLRGFSAGITLKMGKF
jgi:hypothetical protein